MPCQLTFPQNSAPFHWLFLLFLNMVSEFQKSKFSDWETSLFAKWKRVQQTMVLDSPNALSTYFSSEFRSIFIVFINDLNHDFWIPKKSKFSNWETLRFAKWKKRSANYDFRQSKCPVHLLFLRIPVHFHCIYKWFSSWFLDAEK